MYAEILEQCLAGWKRREIMHSFVSHDLYEDSQIYARIRRFMVRQWQAIDRLLWLVAVAYALTLLALYDPHLAPLRQQAMRLLGQVSVLGR